MKKTTWCLRKAKTGVPVANLVALVHRERELEHLWRYESHHMLSLNFVHLNGNVDDNRASNLRWDSTTEQQIGGPAYSLTDGTPIPTQSRPPTPNNEQKAAAQPERKKEGKPKKETSKNKAKDDSCGLKGDENKQERLREAASATAAEAPKTRPVSVLDAPDSPPAASEGILELLQKLVRAVLDRLTAPAPANR
ncbi:unnamed protein product [Vitrella brassicaformis CCMP3155]|uniref:Uncharacterized protein n=1 Tax=Vitrella brassicaformis (strain CCMP3155) TaxID=1169540 RepID=A0A0G4FEN6_VITBC|nr:unnamed protein product [Vitrella brassicaformis CCMP3155]|eukprot:CEM11661.1 unnamed protein product [Vitrella brassicaformis CCMP3155]